jgi:hypothetical protein
MAETTKQKLGFSTLEPDRMYNAILNIAGAFIVFVTACTVYGQIQANYIHVDKVTTFTIMRDAPDLGLLASATDPFDKAICPAASASSLSAPCITHLTGIRTKVLDAARCNKWPAASPSCTCTYPRAPRPRTAPAPALVCAPRWCPRSRKFPCARMWR